MRHDNNIQTAAEGEHLLKVRQRLERTPPAGPRANCGIDLKLQAHGKPLDYEDEWQLILDTLDEEIAKTANELKLAKKLKAAVLQDGEDWEMEQLT
jgi:hypothetical protein